MNISTHRQIANLHDYFSNFDETQDPARIRISENLSLCEQKKQTSIGFQIVRKLLNDKSFDKETASQAAFVKGVLENMIQGIDPELKTLVQLNQFRKQINSQSQEVQARWRGVHETYCSMYADATAHTISKLQSAVNAQRTFFKAAYMKDISSNPQLPDELLVPIFSQVNLKDLNALKLTCKHFSRITEDSDVQREVFCREVGTSSSHTKDVHILKNHEARCRVMRSRIVEPISLIEGSNWLFAFQLKFNDDHFIVSEAGTRIHIYNSQTKEKEKVLELPYKLIQLYKNDLYIITLRGNIERRNIKTLVPEWEFDTSNHLIDSFFLEKDHLVFTSQDKIIKVDFATKKTVSEELSNFYGFESKCYKGNGWVLQYDWDMYIPISILYPQKAILSDSLGCIPYYIEDNLLYTAVKDTPMVKIFDLDSLELKHSFQVDLKEIQGIAQNKGILYVCDASTIVIIDLLTKKQLNSIQTKKLQKIWAHSDTLFFMTPEGVSYVDFSDTTMSEINIFNLFGLIK